MIPIRRILLCGILSLQSHLSYSDPLSPLSITSEVAQLQGRYHDADYRSAHHSESIRLDIDYLNRYTLGLYGQKNHIDYTDPIDPLSQQDYALRASMNLYSDWFGGKITPQLWHQHINNTDPTQLTDKGKVSEVQLRYQNWQKNWHLRLGYATSNYAALGDVQQWRLGFGAELNRHWFELLYYQIQPKFDADTYQLKDLYHALQFTWQYQLADQRWWLPQSWFGKIIVGERVFAVDSDVYAVTNLMDVEKNRFNLGLDWLLPWFDTQVSLMGSYAKFENTLSNDQYSDLFFYFSLTHQW